VLLQGGHRGDDVRARMDAYLAVASAEELFEGQRSMSHGPANHLTLGIPRRRIEWLSQALVARSTEWSVTLFSLQRLRGRWSHRESLKTQRARSVIS